MGLGAGARACYTRVRARSHTHTHTQTHTHNTHTHTRAHTHAGICADELGDYNGDRGFPGCDTEAARTGQSAQQGRHVGTRRGYSESSVLSNSSGATTATTLMHVSGRPPSPNHSNRQGSVCQSDTPASPRGRRGSDAELQDGQHREEARGRMIRALEEKYEQSPSVQQSVIKLQALSRGRRQRSFLASTSPSWAATVAATAAFGADFDRREENLRWDLLPDAAEEAGKGPVLVHRKWLQAADRHVDLLVKRLRDLIAALVPADDEDMALQAL